MPVGQDRHGLKFIAEDVNRMIANEIAIDCGSNYFYSRVKNMTPDFEKAEEVCKQAEKMFEKALENMMSAESRVSESAKKTSGQIRKSANELADGLQRIEKAANFDKLERYVGLLERAAQALTILASLEKDGKLNKIIGAVK